MLIFRIIIIVILILFTGCKANDNILKKIKEEENKYDKFKDWYKNYLYINKDLRFKVEFDGDWLIIPEYSEFNDFQKKYSKYFSTDYGEVLFIGFNDKYNIGLRCTCEALGLSNDEYFDKIKDESKKDITDYNIKIIAEDEEFILKNIEAYNFVSEIKLNANNIFIFDSILFVNSNYNFRIDVWIAKDIYENQKSYIHKIYNSIDFLNENSDLLKTDENNAVKDNTTDIIK